MELRTLLCALAGLALSGMQPAVAQGTNPPKATEQNIVCELNMNDLLAADLAKVPANQRTSFWASAASGDVAVRKCTQSQTGQTQSISCVKVLTGWTNPVSFQTKTFKQTCQMVSCDNQANFVEAQNQMLKVKVIGAQTVEVSLDCQRSDKS